MHFLTSTSLLHPSFTPFTSDICPPHDRDMETDIFTHIGKLTVYGFEVANNPKMHVFRL